MDYNIEIPAVSRIVSSASPPGERWQKGEFCASSHPRGREILIALYGSCRYMMNDSVYDFIPGTVGLISPGMIHASAYTPADRDLLHLWIHFSRSSGMFGSVLRVSEAGKYGKAPCRINPVHFPDCLQQLVLTRWKAAEKCHCGDEDTVFQLMALPCRLLLNELFLRWEGVLSVPERDSLPGFLRSYISSHAGNGCTLEHLAEISGYSQSHISHLFVKETGQSVGEFINSVRIAHAREALARGVRQKVIAEELGFSSARSFWNWMQKFPELKGAVLQD